MPLPDHLSPLASSSGDTCGFDIMHRCDLGEGRQAVDSHPSAGVTGLCSRRGRKTSRQPRALWISPPGASPNAVGCALCCEEAGAIAPVDRITIDHACVSDSKLSIKQNKGPMTRTSIGKRAGSLSTQMWISVLQTFFVKV